MIYKTRSVIVGRKKGKDFEDTWPCFISLFDANDPHKKNLVPKEIIDYDKIHKVVLEGFDINYLLPGNDLVINDLEFIEIKREGPHVSITGKQKKGTCSQSKST